MSDNPKEQFMNMSYEEMIVQLEKLIDKMDDGELPLEQSLNAFEEGMALITAAREKLDVYKKKIEEAFPEEN